MWALGKFTAAADVFKMNTLPKPDNPLHCTSFHVSLFTLFLSHCPLAKRQPSPQSLESRLTCIQYLSQTLTLYPFLKCSSPSYPAPFAHFSASEAPNLLPASCSPTHLLCQSVCLPSSYKACQRFSGCMAREKRYPKILNPREMGKMGRQTNRAGNLLSKYHVASSYIYTDVPGSCYGTLLLMNFPPPPTAPQCFQPLQPHPQEPPPQRVLASWQGWGREDITPCQLHWHKSHQF